MSMNVHASARFRNALLATVGLILVALSLPVAATFTSAQARGAEQTGQDPADPGMENPNGLGQDPGDDDGMIRFAPKSKSKGSTKKARSTAKPSTKKGTSRKDTAKKDAAKSESEATPREETSSTDLKFSQDIAPILAKNCSGCHGGTGNGLRRGKLDLTTFEKMMKGTPGNPGVVTPGNPEESSLVLRLRGEGGARMPQGGQNMMAETAIAKIEQWVKSGAKLDAGIDPKVAFDSYAPSPEQLARKELAKLTPAARDKQVEEVGLARWKKAIADTKIKPEVLSGAHFIMFTNLPATRAKKDLDTLDKQYNHLKSLLGSQAVDWVEKVSVFAFADKKEFAPFVAALESREVDADVVATAKLTGAQPYIAVLDPLGGKKEEPAARRKTKSKRGESESSGPDRTLAGLLTETFASATYATAGGDKTAPRWLKEGLGSYMASVIEPRSPHYRQLRQAAFRAFDRGWPTQASEVMGGSANVTADEVQAVSFALVESMMSSELRQGFAEFLGGMLAGPDKLDDVLKRVYGYNNREEFLNDTGEFVASRYGPGQ
jgi:hypothetical protein